MQDRNGHASAHYVPPSPTYGAEHMYAFVFRQSDVIQWKEVLEIFLPRNYASN